jgi:xylulokinase
VGHLLYQSADVPWSYPAWAAAGSTNIIGEDDRRVSWARIGTSSVKAVQVDAAGSVKAVASRALDVSHPNPMWSEQNPDSWVEATIGAVDELTSTHPVAVAAVRGVGLSGQMHGATLLDAAGTPLRPAILWNDGRSHAECRELEARLPALHSIAGNLVMPGFTAPKLLWVANHEPEIFRRTAKVLLPKAYVRFRLTGIRVEDMSDAAARSGLMSLV